MRTVCRFAAGKIDLKLKKCPSAEMRRGFCGFGAGLRLFWGAGRRPGGGAGRRPGGGAGRRPGGEAADAGGARGFRRSRRRGRSPRVSAKPKRPAAVGCGLLMLW